MEMVVKGIMPYGLNNAVAAAKALMYADSARFLAQLVWMIGNFGFVFLALHFLSKTMVCLYPESHSGPV